MNPRPIKNWGALTDVGRVRSHNEDSVLAEPPLFVVADGLGGHEAGEVASSIAIQTLRDNAPRRADANALARAVRAANREVMRAAREGIGRSGMGTTITAAIVDGCSVAVAQVGDSRAYLLHDGLLSRITQDHSMVADLIRSGQITEAESRVHPNRSVITRALGTDPNVVADAYEVDAAPGDRIMLCSDGLTTMLEDTEIAELLGKYRDPVTAAAGLIAAANEAGGHDNISVVVVDVEGQRTGRGIRASERSARGAFAVAAWVFALVALVAGMAYGAYLYARNEAFLIAENDVIAVYRGVPGAFAGVSLKWYAGEVNVDVRTLSPATQARLEAGEQVSDLEAAYARAEAYARQSGQVTPPAPGTTPGSNPDTLPLTPKGSKPLTSTGPDGGPPANAPAN
jgi:protein phosphatase